MNCGGLFPLNNMTLIFFISVEKEVCAILLAYMRRQTADSENEAFKDQVIKKIVRSEEVQWNWTLNSQCIDSEEHALELLCEIVTFWVTVWGFSITAK